MAYRNLVKGRKNFMDEELVKVLLEGKPLTFLEIFELLLPRLRKRKAARSGEDMLRLRARDRLNVFVFNGWAVKANSQYSGSIDTLKVVKVQLENAK